MDYTTWIALFGKSATDPAVVSALAAANVTKALVIASDELGVSADIPNSGMTIGFTDESVLSPATGLIGKPILTSVLMILHHPSRRDIYTGPLPLNLVKATSREDMRKRFGAPVSFDEDMGWDSWLVENHQVTATYRKDWQSIARLSLKVPASD